MRRVAILAVLILILLALLGLGYGALLSGGEPEQAQMPSASPPPVAATPALTRSEPTQVGPRLPAVVPAAAVPLPAPAPGGRASLKDAIIRCGAVKSMLDRVKCYDQLVRDIRDFEEVLTEACPCGAAGETEAAAKAATAAAAAQRALTTARSSTAARSTDATRTGAQTGGVRDVALREGYGTGKWKQIPRYKDNGELIAVRLELVAETDIRGQSQKVARPVMTINCTDKGTEVWMETSFTSAGNATPVTMQFDDDEPYVYSWANTADGKFMGIWQYGEDFAKRAMPYDRFKVTFTPDGGSSTSTWFDIRGLTLAAKPLRQVCIW
jgi:hypothetical protein